ncbi:MAG: hypothetical protein KGJ88_03035 [Verrucomicrobiota bacterium]|nr:hypothetical protein [Verrucomicrobiota bacterium]
MIIAGMGELHLEIIRDRLFREFKVEANAGAPQIAHGETILKPAENRLAPETKKMRFLEGFELILAAWTRAKLQKSCWRPADCSN